MIFGFACVLGIFYGVINGEPLKIDYSVIGKSLNAAMSAQAEKGLLNLILTVILLAVAVYLFRLYGERDLAKRVEHWRRVEVIKPDYSYRGSSGQRRSWVRVKADMDFDYVVLDETGNPMTEAKRAPVIDLSAGGLSFLSDEDLTAGRELLAFINLDEEQLLRVKARVVRVLKDPDGENRWTVGVQFLNLREGDEERIVRWSIRRQREIIEKNKDLKLSGVKAGREDTAIKKDDPS